jgi:hypothetical protein
MQAMLLGVTFAALSVMWFPTPYAFAADTRVARGTVVSIGGSSLSIKVRDEEMRFSIDPKTVVEARGAGTKTRSAQARGKSGPDLNEVLAVGQAVAVTYHELNGVLHASVVRAMPAAGVGTSGTEPEYMTSAGTVQIVAPNSLTLTGSGGGGSTFTQTFGIDERTKVFAKGAGTAAAATGGRLPFTQIVSSGDHVNVSYHKVGDALLASEVRVTMKPKP